MGFASRARGPLLDPWVRPLGKLICGKSAKCLGDIKLNVVFKTSGAYLQLPGCHKLCGFGK